jgi:hypothetical protein
MRGNGMDSLSWTQIVLVMASSLLITLLVFAGLVWRDYRHDRSNRS